MTVQLDRHTNLSQPRPSSLVCPCWQYRYSFCRCRGRVGLYTQGHRLVVTDSHRMPLRWHGVAPRYPLAGNTHNTFKHTPLGSWRDLVGYR